MIQISINLKEIDAYDTIAVLIKGALEGQGDYAFMAQFMATQLPEGW